MQTLKADFFMNLPHEIRRKIRRFLLATLSKKAKAEVLSIKKWINPEVFTRDDYRHQWLSQKLILFNVASLASTTMVLEVLHTFVTRVDQFFDCCLCVPEVYRQKTIMRQVSRNLNVIWRTLTHPMPFSNEQPLFLERAFMLMFVEVDFELREVFERVISKVELRPQLEEAVNAIKEDFREADLGLGPNRRVFLQRLEIIVWFWYLKRMAERLVMNTYIPFTPELNTFMPVIGKQAAQILRAIEGDLNLKTTLESIPPEGVPLENRASNPLTPMCGGDNGKGLHPCSFDSAQMFLAAKLPHMYPLAPVEMKLLKTPGFEVAIPQKEIRDLLLMVTLDRDTGYWIKKLLCSEQFSEHKGTVKFHIGQLMKTTST